jgi:PAS domain S-box-containing protein
MVDERVEILVVDDDEDDFVIVKDLLSDISESRFSVRWEPDYEKARDYIHQQCFDIYLIDYRLGKMNGLDLLRDAVAINRRKPVIMLTGQGEPEVDLEAMQLGAADYLVKDRIDAQSIERSIRYALSNAQAMYKLYEQENKYRALFEQSLNAIFIINQEFHFADVNPAMVELFGYGFKELIDHELSSLFSINDEYEMLKQRLQAEGHVRNMEVLFSSKEGIEFICNLSITRIFGGHKKVEGYQGIIEDISERKKVQQELIQLEKLIMTGNIARSIAHEVRNPLTNINLAIEQFSADLDEDTLEVYLDIIKRNTKRINQLITEMLKSSKPSQLNLEPESLNQVIEKSLKLAEDRIRLREIRVDKQYDDDMPHIAMDKEKLSMALLNVINNAIEAVDARKGILTVQTSRQGTHQVLKISDNGPGISAEDLNKLFDAFHTGKKGGMGLGLTFTQNIVNSHGAKISVDSSPEQGSSFTITFTEE